MFSRKPKPGTAHVYVDKKGNVTRVVSGGPKPGSVPAKGVRPAKFKGIAKPPQG